RRCRVVRAIVVAIVSVMAVTTPAPHDDRDTYGDEHNGPDVARRHGDDAEAVEEEEDAEDDEDDAGDERGGVEVAHHRVVPVGTGLPVGAGVGVSVTGVMAGARCRTTICPAPARNSMSNFVRRA